MNIDALKTRHLPLRFRMTLALFLLSFAVAGAQASQGYGDQRDPPSRVARIGYLRGNVSLEPVGIDRFSRAELNYPLTDGDRIYADNQSLAELQISGLTLRLGNGADVTLSSLTDQVAQFGLSQGSVRLRTHNLTGASDPYGEPVQDVVEIDTTNAAILVEAPGDIRVDAYPQDDTTVVTVNSGQVRVTAPGVDRQLGRNQSLRLTGTARVSVQSIRLLPADELDRFSQDREHARERSIALHDQYVSPDMIGVDDLDDFGDWTPSPEYGQVWFPRAVRADWAPYRNGRWAWVAPWGWTWIEEEPWGFAPFHYGRWASFNGRWGWVPGPPPGIFGRRVCPVYSPALVAFVGPGFGRHPENGVTAWFPLAPREVYMPWYRVTPAYANRVNVTNIYNRNEAEVHNTYLNRTVDVYRTNRPSGTYINRPTATTVVDQRDFASGRRVAESQLLRMDGAARRQLDRAPVVQRPIGTPAMANATPQTPPRALPPTQARPIFTTHHIAERGPVAPPRLIPPPLTGGPHREAIGGPPDTPSMPRPEQQPIPPVPVGIRPRPIGPSRYEPSPSPAPTQTPEPTPPQAPGRMPRPAPTPMAAPAPPTQAPEQNRSTTPGRSPRQPAPQAPGQPRPAPSAAPAPPRPQPPADGPHMRVPAPEL